MIIYVDIDETIARTPTTRDYSKSIPIKENIKKINKLYDKGDTIVYWTARGSTTRTSWFDITQKQLKKWGCKFHELRMGKPPFDLLIDDKTKRIEEL